MLLQVTENVETIHDRHLKIEQNEIDLTMLQMLDRRFPIRYFIDIKVIVSKEVGESHPLDW